MRLLSNRQHINTAQHEVPAASLAVLDRRTGDIGVLPSDECSGAGQRRRRRDWRLNDVQGVRITQSVWVLKMVSRKAYSLWGDYFRGGVTCKPSNTWPCLSISNGE